MWKSRVCAIRASEYVNIERKAELTVRENRGISVHLHVRIISTTTKKKEKSQNHFWIFWFCWSDVQRSVNNVSSKAPTLNLTQPIEKWPLENFWDKSCQIWIFSCGTLIKLFNPFDILSFYIKWRRLRSLRRACQTLPGNLWWPGSEQLHWLNSKKHYWHVRYLHFLMCI